MLLPAHYEDLLSIYGAIKICQCFETGIGISANAFLLVFHVFRFLLDHRPKPTDLTICHLAFVHIVKLFAALFLFPEFFESLYFQNDVKCKSLFYLARVIRALSMCNTCLLSVLQAITISPNTAWFSCFKQKSTTFTFQSFFFLWFINMFLDSNVIFYTTASSNVTQANVMFVNEYCSLAPMDTIYKNLVFTLALSRDVFFVGMMLLSSVYMVVLLIRHQRRCQHLYSSSFSLKTSPEKRAVHSILLLVSFFVFLSCIDLVISSTLIVLWAYDPVLLNVHTLVVNFYATITPLVLITSDKRIIHVLQNMC